MKLRFNDYTELKYYPEDEVLIEKLCPKLACVTCGFYTRNFSKLVKHYNEKHKDCF